MKIVLNYVPADEHRAALQAAAPHATYAVAGTEDEARVLIRDADALLGNRWFLQSVAAAERLRWFQSNSVGMDLVLRARPHLANVVVTNARGVYSAEMAEHALALILSLFRGLHELRDAQREARWAPRPLRTIAGSTFLVLGWGSLGQAIGRRLQALGARVHGAGRNRIVTLGDGGRETVAAECDWRSLLSSIDCLVLALPAVDETRHLAGAGELRLLRPNAFVVNVGRGPTLDERALIDALRESRIAGAALDVLENEPADAASEVWRVPSLIVTPHVARSREEAPPFRWEPLFVENVRRFAAGEPLLNVVDPERGY